jgi:hypothetical protein
MNEEHTLGHEQRAAVRHVYNASSTNTKPSIGMKTEIGGDAEAH